MSDLIAHEISIFAQRHNVPVAQAYTLPVIFEKMAAVVGQPVRSIISQATYSNPALAEYVKELAAKVA